VAESFPPSLPFFFPLSFLSSCLPPSPVRTPAAAQEFTTGPQTAMRRASLFLFPFPFSLPFSLFPSFFSFPLTVAQERCEGGGTGCPPPFFLLSFPLYSFNPSILLHRASEAVIGRIRRRASPFSFSFSFLLFSSSPSPGAWDRTVKKRMERARSPPLPPSFLFSHFFPQLRRTGK